MAVRHALGGPLPPNVLCAQRLRSQPARHESVRMPNLGAPLGVGCFLVQWHDKGEQRAAAAGWLHVTCSDSTRVSQALRTLPSRAGAPCAQRWRLGAGRTRDPLRVSPAS